MVQILLFIWVLYTIVYMHWAYLYILLYILLHSYGRNICSGIHAEENEHGLSLDHISCGRTGGMCVYSHPRAFAHSTAHTRGRISSPKTLRIIAWWSGVRWQRRQHVWPHKIRHVFNVVENNSGTACGADIWPSTPSHSFFDSLFAVHNIHVQQLERRRKKKQHDSIHYIIIYRIVTVTDISDVEYHTPWTKPRAHTISTIVQCVHITSSM